MSFMQLPRRDVACNVATTTLCAILWLCAAALASATPAQLIGGTNFLQWSGLTVGDAGAVLAVPGEARWLHPEGPRGYHRTGFRAVHDGALNLRDFWGLQFEVTLADEQPVRLDVSVKAPRMVDQRQDYLPGATTAVTLQGAGRHVVSLPWSQFDFPQAAPSFLHFIHDVRIRATSTNGAARGTLMLAQPRAVCGEIIGLRAPVRGRAGEPGDEIAYEVLVENATDRPQAVALALQTRGWEALAATVTPSVVSVPAAGRATCAVRVVVSERLPRGGRERQTLVASVGGQPAGTLTFVTARDVEHPYLLHTRARWDEVRAKVEQHAWARELAEARIEQASRWQVPEVARQRITPDDGMGEYLFATAVESNLIDCAIAWQLTRDRAYAEKIRLFLQRLSDPVRGYPDTLRACSQNLVQEGHFFKYIMQAYDAVLDAGVVTAADRAQLEATLRLFMRTTDFEVGTGNVSNWTLSQLSGALFAALLLGDGERAERFYRGPGGVLDQFGQGVMDDGWWYECAIGYNSWMAELGTEIGLAVEPWGEELRTMRIPNGYAPNFGLMPWQSHDGLYGMSFQKWGPLTRNHVRLTDLWDSFLPFLDWRGVMFGANDSDERKITGHRYELAYYVYRDPRYAAMIRYADDRDLLWGVPELPADDPGLYRGSAASDNAGIVVLRAQTPDRPQRERLQAVLKYGSHGGFHGHFDRASLLSVMRYGRSFFNPELVWYGYDSFLYKFLVQGSLTKNMVVVDTKMQEPVASKHLLFHRGSALQVSCVETKARWSYPPYGGMIYEYIPAATNFAAKLRLEGRSLDLPTNAPPYGAITGYTKPVLQRRLLAVTDDYLLLADYLSATEPHTFDLLHQVKGFRGLTAPTQQLVRHTAALDADPLNAAQLITDCDWYEVSGPAVARFEMDFTGKQDRESGFSRVNEPGPLFMDVHAAWPAGPREVVVGTLPENLKGTRRKVRYAARSGTNVLAQGEVGTWALGVGRVEVSVSGVEEVVLTAQVEKAGERSTLFWTPPVAVTADGREIAVPVSALAFENTVAAPPAGEDYEGGPIKMAGTPLATALPAEPVDPEQPARLTINLRGLGAVTLKAQLGGDYPFGDERWRRKTLSVRTRGTEARYLTVIEAYEAKAMVKKVEASGPDRITVELADGRVQELVIRGLEGSGAGVSVALTESKDGQVIRKEITTQ